MVHDALQTFAELCLCHSILEDTLLMAAVGAHFSGILVGRFIFAAVTVLLLKRAISILPPKLSNRYFMKSLVPEKEDNRG